MQAKLAEQADVSIDTVNGKVYVGEIKQGERVHMQGAGWGGSKFWGVAKWRVKKFVEYDVFFEDVWYYKQ